MRKVVIVPGDGVGPEVVSATYKVISEVTDQIEFTRFDAGLKYYKEQGDSMPRALLDEAKDCDAVLMGTMLDSDEKGYVNPESELIRFLGLTTHIHRIRSVVPGKSTRDIDSYVITPNDIINPITEMEDVDGITRSIRMQYQNSRIVFDAAVSIARKCGFDKVMCVNYSSVYKMTSQRHIENFRTSFSNSGLRTEDMYIEDYLPALIRGDAPDGIITTPLVYSYLIGASLSSYVGGLELTAIEDYDRESAVFKPAHGAMPEIAGMDKVNPIGSIMSGVMMLKHFGMHEEARKIEEAIGAACRRGYMTEDLGGRSSRTEFLDQVLEFCKD